MKVLSWNILANEFIAQKYYTMIPSEILFNRQQRQDNILATLLAIDADIMLLQEVMQSEYNLLTTHYDKTHHIIRGKYITWQNKRGYSGNVTLLRKQMFSFTAEQTNYAFGLSVKCYHLKIPFLILNVHLDDVSADKRISALLQMETDIKQNANVILGGDFNEDYQKNKKLYTFIKSAVGLKIYNHRPTYYIGKELCIDNIAIKGLKEMKNIALNRFGGDIIQQISNYGSDHLPVLVGGNPPNPR